MENSSTQSQRRRLAARTFLAVLAVTLAISLIAGVVLFRAVEQRYIAVELEAHQQIARTIAGLLQARINEGSAPGAVLSWLQSGITDTEQQSAFVCLLDDEGRVLSHPDPEIVRSGATVDSLIVDAGGGKVPYPQLLSGVEPGRGLLFQSRHGDLYQLVNYWPVEGTPWRVSVHENVAVLQSELVAQRNRFMMGAGVFALLLATAASAAARTLHARYERRIEKANDALEQRVGERTAELTEALHNLQLAHERLVHGEKMNLLGELMAGIAHDLRSPLMQISIAAQLLDRKVADRGQPVNTAMIHAGVKRADGVITTLLGFAKQQPPVRACIDLAEMVRRSVELVTTELRHAEIALTMDLASDVPNVMADAQQLQQVILNLLSNARQALVSAPTPRRVRVGLRHEGDGVVTEVEDNGPGVPEALRDRIFASFFTTKQEGTGLGLALCRRFMESNGGTIELAPSAAGARFVITLPVAVEQ